MSFVNKSGGLTGAFVGALFSMVAMGGAVHAATFTFDATITEISQGSSATYPVVGSSAQIVLNIDDSIPGRNIFLPGGAADAFMSVSVDASGFFSGSLPPGSFDSDPLDGLTLSGTGFHYGSAYGPSNVVQPGTGMFAPWGLHYFNLTFGTPVTSPVTIDELVAAISAPGTTGVFSWEGEDRISGFDHIRVEFDTSDTSIPPVPLPATGLMLIGGLGLLGGLRRRKSPK